MRCRREHMIPCLGTVERKTNEIHKGLTWLSRIAVRQCHAVVVIMAREAKVLSPFCAPLLMLPFLVPASIRCPYLPSHWHPIETRLRKIEGENPSTDMRRRYGHTARQLSRTVSEYFPFN